MRVLCGARLCCAPQPGSGGVGGRGRRVRPGCQFGQRAVITLLHTPKRPNCFQNEKYLDDSLTPPSHGESATDLQIGYRGKRQKQTETQTSWKMSHRYGQTVGLTNRKTEIDKDRVSGRLHWLFPRLHKQLQLWT